MAKELRKRKPDLVFPIIHAFFGDSASANLDSEIAVFTEQCYQKREMLKEKYGRRGGRKETPAGIEVRAIRAATRSTQSLKEVKR
jgi:hypothetical protein